MKTLIQIARDKFSMSILFSVVIMLGFSVKYLILATRVFSTSLNLLLVLRLALILIGFLVWLHPLARFRKGRIILLVITLLGTIFFFMNLWYNRYFGNYLSLSDLLMGRGMRPVKVLIFQIFHITDGLYLLDIVLLSLLIRSKDILGYQRSKRIGLHSVLLVVGFISVSFTANLMYGGQRPIDLYRNNSPVFVSIYGILPLYGVEFIDLAYPELLEPFLIPTEDIPQIENDFSGTPKAKQEQNIICIQIESLDSAVLDFQYSGREVTPFLNRIKKRSLYFSNFYAQHVNGSFDAELSSLTSIYPMNRNYGFKVNDLGLFDSLVPILKQRGYTSVAFHGNDKSFFFRDKAYDELGFDRLYSREAFDELNLKYPDTTSTFGINDFDFFQQAADMIEQLKQPFFAYFITVTSHTPFDFYPEQKRLHAFDSIENPLVRDYFNSIAFVDASLESFFERLQEMGLLENSLILIYGDHNAGINKSEYQSAKPFVLESPVKTPESVPLLIMHPELTPNMRTKEGSHTDLAPTILDFLGEAEKPKEFMGYSLLNSLTAPVLFLHELPQLLHQGQLYVFSIDGLNRVGYDPSIGKRTIAIPEKEYEMMLTYIREILFKRRITESAD
jgi:phosphoglycerol transferase MdoB-like AlkP superfamily enzyme